MFTRFLSDESGATAIEYALIAALIGLVIATGAATLGSALNTFFSTVATTLSGRAPTAGP